MPSNGKRKTGIRPGDRKGFALITAIMAIMILMALGFLAISVTMGDFGITGRVVGEKKALSATETGIHRLMQNFQPGTSSEVTNQPVDAVTDPASLYSISNVAPAASGPASVPMPGYGLGWGQERFVASVTGINTNYKSSVTVDVGMGFFCWVGTTYQ
jgi:hypothetical protein